MLTLNSEIIKINRVGEKLAKKLKKLGVLTARDLLFYFPFRYDDFSKITAIKDLAVILRQAQDRRAANIVGRIELIQNKRSHRRRMYITEALLSDETESVRVIWFNQPFITRLLKVGDKVSLAGKVEEDFGAPVMMSPAYEKIANAEGRGLNADLRGRAVHTQGLVPNYRLTAGLTHKQLRFLIKSVIYLAKNIKDWLPAEVKNELKLLPLAEAINKIHFPRGQEDIDKAKRRLAFDELFLLQLQSQMVKEEMKTSRAQPIEFFEKETKKFVENLPFKLTTAQRQSAWEILQGISRGRPMARLLEGDVGSGKTIVAAIAMLNVALNKKQAVLMAPTEILARQHYESILKLVGNEILVCLLTRSQFLISNFQFLNKFQNSNDKITKKDILKNIKNGKCKIIIGTHALIQEDVKFKNLALAIIDEQHRFGVEQRKMLAEKSKPHPGSTELTEVNPLLAKERAIMPHLLSMTATPIPRSLALALYGDLDMSIINEMPVGRKKIITRVVPEEKREAAYRFIREQIKNGRQVFVICPLIDISDKLGVKSVKVEFEKLDKEVFSEIKMGMLHGRLKSADREQVMREFLNNEIKILVSTSVVEVGMDVPNATIMMIEGAERFGLAQLHQFRGRVGRAKHQSYCFLFTSSEITPRSSATAGSQSGTIPAGFNASRKFLTEFTESDAEKTLKRLNALVDYNDGMTLAKVDLKLRGPGEVYGTTQSGFPELKIASLFDYELMKQARDEAVKLLARDKSLASWPELKNKAEEYNKNVHLE